MIVGENDPRSLGGDLMGFIPALVAVRVDHLFLWDIVTASPLPILQNRPPTAILKWQWAGYSVRDFLKVINPSSLRTIQEFAVKNMIIFDIDLPIASAVDVDAL